jgi:hypothetical protein
MRYEATMSDALFLIEHMLDVPDGVSAPTGFLSRATWNDMFLADILEQSVYTRDLGADENDQEDELGDEDEDYDAHQGRDCSGKHGN